MVLLRYFWSYCFVMTLVLLSSFSNAIVGGRAADANSVPGQVALIDLSRDPGTCSGSEIFCKQYCSGVLITSQWIMTAAHCVSNVLLGDLRVLASTSDLSTAAPSDLVNVIQKVVHGQYGVGATFNNDIALLKLEEPLGLPVASVAEASAYSTFAGLAEAYRDDAVVVSGWGRLGTNGAFPLLLQKVSLNLLSDSVCESSYNPGQFVTYMSANMLCAGETTPELIEADDAGDLTPYDEAGEGVCNYDSGGPLSFFGNGFRQVAGLTSFAPSGDCASTTLPSVFTRVSTYAPWVEASGKEGGDNFGDLALSITGDTSKATGTPADVTVQLRNASGLPSGVALPVTTLTGTGFTVVASAGGTLALKFTPSRLNCTAIVGGFRCSSLDALDPSVFRVATFTVTPVSGNQVVTITTSAFVDASNNLKDYRQGNNKRQHRIVYSSLPDVALELSGFAQEVVNIAQDSSSADGRAWVMGKIVNRSSNTSASNIALSLDMSTGLQWEAWEGLGECVSSQCTLPTLAAGEERLFRIRVFSPGARNGSVRLTAGVANGDFPTLVSGTEDKCGAVAVKFNVASSQPDGEVLACQTAAAPSEGGGGSSGGGAGWGSLLVLGLGLVLRRRWH